MPKAPWWRIVTVLVLAAALGVALDAGRFFDAAIIGALLLLSLVPVALWIADARRRR
jgi:hypothetical protein